MTSTNAPPEGCNNSNIFGKTVAIIVSVKYSGFKDGNNLPDSKIPAAMKILFLLFLLLCTNAAFSQHSIFGTYVLKTSLIGDSTEGTILQLKCDHTYSREDRFSKDWGKWKLHKNGDFMLMIDTMSNKGRTERFKATVYYNIVNGQLKLDERNYSKQAFKKDTKKANRLFKANNVRFRARYTDEAFESWRLSTMSLYYEKQKTLVCE